MDTKPVVQNFLGKPVRFFKTTFEVKVRGRNDPQSTHFFILQTVAIPFPDLCTAVSYDERAMRRLIEVSKDTFAGLWRTEPLPDALGRIRPTILLSQEMADGLVFKLSTSRIKDIGTRERVIDFQRFIMLTIGLIRRGKLKVTHDLATAFSCPPEYQNLLSLPSGSDLARAVNDQAAREGKSPVTVYRHLRRLRGGNVMTPRGVPRKNRAA